MKRFVIPALILPLHLFGYATEMRTASRMSYATEMQMPSRLGDARFGAEQSFFMTNILFNIALQPGEYSGLTVTGWVRLLDITNSYLTTQAFWTPEAVRTSNPDLLGGSGGYPASGFWDGASGTNLTTLGGAVTVAAFPWQPYTDTHISNQWPRGVYTIAGWSSNAVTVTLGGKDVTVGPGTFNRNTLPGPADSCVISGGGQICIGISRTPDAQYFQEIDGVTTNQVFLTGESIVTNEIVFCTWRISLTATNHLYSSTIDRLDACTLFLGKTVTNAMPRSARTLSSQGRYSVGLMGTIREKPGIGIALFDVRVHARWLSNDELLRIHMNGAEEIRRRQIPQWR